LMRSPILAYPVPPSQRGERLLLYTRRLSVIMIRSRRRYGFSYWRKSRLSQSWGRRY
jgi:hypothetical protein